MLILLYFISPVKIFWCVKYYKAQPYNMEHTLCVCVNNQTPTPNKIYMSDTQIMMEHIIELNNQVNKLMTKQKKLKKKYKTLKYDIYEDVDEEKQITQEPKQETKQEPTREPIQETKQDTAQDVTQDTAQDIKPSYRTAGIRVLPQKGWRSYISYL